MLKMQEHWINHDIPQPRFTTIHLNDGLIGVRYCRHSEGEGKKWRRPTEESHVESAREQFINMIFLSLGVTTTSSDDYREWCRNGLKNLPFVNFGENP